MTDASKLVDSAKITEDVAKGGNLRVYWNTLKSNPMKIVIGVWESLCEIFRWVFWPRVRVQANVFKRIATLFRFIWAELKIPGGTTTLEAIWISYGAHMASSPSPTWVQVGCFKGLSAARLSLIAEIMNKQLRVYDTFDGLPGSDAIYNSVDGGVNYEFKAGSYRGAEDEVKRNVAAHGRPDRITLVKGDVRNTLPDNAVNQISYAYLDVDLVESYKGCFKGLAGAIEQGTIIGIHEACYQPIRNLIEDATYWKSISIGAPEIVYVAEAFKIRSCRNLAFLKW
jgi:hypothetical protein